MPFYESKSAKRLREQRQRKRYPEFEIDDFDTIASVDAFARANGEFPTRFGQDVEKTASRVGIPEEDQFEIEQRFGRRPPVVPEFEGPDPRDQLQPLAFRTQQEAENAAAFAAEIEANPELQALFDQPALTQDRPTIERLTSPENLIQTAGEGVDLLTGGLTVRTGIAQGSQLFTDPIGAHREQLERERQGGVGFGLEEAAPFEQLGRVPGIRADIPGTGISAFDIATGATDVIADFGGVAGALSLGDAAIRTSPEIAETVRVSAFRSLLPEVPDSTLRQIPEMAGGSPHRLNPDAVIANGSGRGEAAFNAVRSAQRRGEEIGSEALRVLSQASVIVEQDKPGVMGRILDSIPGVSTVRAVDQPRLRLPDDVLETYVAQAGAISDFNTRSLPSRMKTFETLDLAFGEGASKGDFLPNVRYLGPDDGYPAIGTAYDILQRPDMYELDELREVLIRKIDERNLMFSNLANEGYGTEIGRFVSSRPGAAYLPNVDVSDAAEQLRQISTTTGTRTVSGIRSKPRVFDTGYDRWLNDLDKVARGEIDEAQAFIPETDIRKLLTALDSQKANAVGSSVWRQGLPGRTLVEVKEDVAPRLVELRNSLRTNIDSLRGRIRRAEQSIRRDAQSAALLERQIAENDDRISQFVRQAEQLEDGLPELDAIKGIIDELEIRQGALNSAVTGPSSRYFAQSGRIAGLREELAEVLEEYASVRRAYEATNLRGEQFVGDGLYRYFPAEQAQQLQDLSRTTTHKFFEVLAQANAGVLSGDGSIILGVHGQLAFLMRPYDTTIKALGGLAEMGTEGITGGDWLRTFRLGTLADDIAQDPDAWADFSFFLGRPVGNPEALIDEFRGGYFADMAEKIGVPIGEMNDGMYRVITRRMFDDWQAYTQRLVRDGAPIEEAKAAAIDVVTKAIPTLNTRRLGQSAAQATAQRAPFTSIAFLRNPSALAQEAAMAYFKTATFQPLTLRQELARDVVTRIVGTSVTLTATFAYMDALAKGIDPEEHVKNAVTQLRLHVPNTKYSIPIGGTFRGIWNAVRPRDTEVAGLGIVPLPFMGIPQFLANRTAPFISTQLEIYNDEDYYGNPVRDGDFPINILKALAYERNAFFPIAAQGVVENTLAGDSPQDIIVEAAGDVAGGQIAPAPEFIREQEAFDAAARGQEWSNPNVNEGEPFTVNSFDELSELVGSVVAEQMIEPFLDDDTRKLQEAQREEALEQAGVDDPDAAYASLDALGQEWSAWALNIQSDIDSGDRTLADARRWERQKGFTDRQRQIIKDFQPVFEREEPPTFEQLSALTDVNEVRNAYFAIMEQHIDPDTDSPTDEFFDVVEPRIISAVGESMWARVEANMGVKNRAPWQIEVKEIRERLAAAEYFDIRDFVWEQEATNAGVIEEFPDPDDIERAIYIDFREGGYDDATAMVRARAKFDGMGIIERWRDRSNRLEEIFIRTNPELAADGVRAGYITIGNLRNVEAEAITNR